MNKKVAGIAFLALILVAVFFLTQRWQSQPATAQTPTLTAEVTRGSIEESVGATGNVVARQQATLAFAMSGQIVEVLVKEGQQVQAGDPLARLDTASLEWQVASAQAALKTAQAQLAQARQPASAEELASAQAALESARAAYDRVRQGPGAEELASARAALESAQANYDKVKAGPTAAELATAKAQLDSAKATLRQAQAAYDRIKDQPDVAMRPESLNLQNATITLEQAQANYDSLARRPTASDLAAAAAQVAQARAQLATLLKQPTASDLTTAAAQVAQAEAQLAALQAQPQAEMIAVYQAQVEQATVALAQAQDQLKNAVLTAPFAGTVLSVNINQGEWASPGAPAIILAATTDLFLDVKVDEVDVARLAEGQTAYLSFDALKGERITGTVIYIAPSATSVSGAVAYPVEIRFDPGTLPIRLGMTANVDIVVAHADNALLVPNRAIEADRAVGRYYVTRQTVGGASQRVEVRIGLRDRNMTQVVEGLNEGDRVILPQLPSQSQESNGFGGPFGGFRSGGGQ